MKIVLVYKCYIIEVGIYFFYQVYTCETSSYNDDLLFCSV